MMDSEVKNANTTFALESCLTRQACAHHLETVSRQILVPVLKDTLEIIVSSSFALEKFQTRQMHVQDMVIVRMLIDVNVSKAMQVQNVNFLSASII